MNFDFGIERGFSRTAMAMREAADDMFGEMVVSDDTALKLKVTGFIHLLDNTSVYASVERCGDGSGDA
jgi:hypothetical protein